MAWVLVSFGPGRVFADCDLRNIETKYYHNQGGILRTNQARCCGDAKAGAIKKFEDNVNLVKRYSSSAKSDAQKISASYNPVTKTGSGSLEQSKSEGTVLIEEFKGITWIAVVENCECVNLQEKSGDDCSSAEKAIGRCGKKANGYCISDVKCRFRYYSPMLDADCKKYLKEPDEEEEEESNYETDKVRF